MKNKGIKFFFFFLDLLKKSKRKFKFVTNLLRLWLSNLILLSIVWYIINFLLLVWIYICRGTVATGSELELTAQKRKDKELKGQSIHKLSFNDNRFQKIKKKIHRVIMCVVCWYRISIFFPSFKKIYSYLTAKNLNAVNWAYCFE